MFRTLTKTLAFMTSVSGTATIISGIHDYKMSLPGEIPDEPEDIEDIKDISDGDVADEIMNEV